MPLPRLRRKSRIEPTTRGVSTAKLATNQRQWLPGDTQPDAAPYTGGVSSMFLSSAGSQLSTRLLRNILSSANNENSSIECTHEGSSDGGDQPLSRTQSPRPPPLRGLQTESWRARRGSSNRSTQGPTVDLGSDAARPRRRLRRGVSPAVPPVTKAQPQHSPPQPAPRPDETKKALVACPFYKFDPNAHRDCRRFGISRVKDVKQHLYRKHFSQTPSGQPNDGFGTPEYLGAENAHEAYGSRDDEPVPGSISEEQWKELLKQRYQSRGKSVEDQWNDIWRTLFPARDPPRSIYLDNDDDGEVLSRLRAFWSRRRADITSKTIRESGTDAGSFHASNSTRAAHLFDQVIKTFLTEFEAESTMQAPSVNAYPDTADDLLYVMMDNDSVASIATDPRFVIENGGFLPDYEQYSTPEVKPAALWQSQSYFSASNRDISACPSTNSLPDTIYESKPFQFSLASGPESNRDWVSPWDVAPSETYDPTAFPQFEDSMTMSVQPPHPQYRHTWSGPSSGQWPPY
ncbi:hypothetical protein B0T16DRAFT_411811 [Cercophora newfieldiana]|uniref:Uncharacterized protein n=1 Tax=Cercophora newfieldiana TaxID=92897 RepID=A0AA40CP20_9PEZI|nr:hypothetical protein B0T16DRAFT_411811 [Cercophora newfieldiana]